MIDINEYEARLERLFVRFPSVQNVGFQGAYKPGLEHMEAFDRALGEPSRAFRSVHVAGTNGKGSVANMLASALSAAGCRVGLYTSPHIVDFRERIRVIEPGEGATAEMITREGVWDFLENWGPTCDELDLSFFEITTGMAFWWFREREVDFAVVEVGLGGRLDSTNILIPQAAVITSIGLDHCALLGGTRQEIAGEKAGIFKSGVPAIVGASDPETAPVFEEKAARSGAQLIFADAQEPLMWPLSGKMIGEMDLQGPCQPQNLRTVLTTLDAMGVTPQDPEMQEALAAAITATARRMDFHGRWEMIGREPDTICDIGHNPPALKENFARLQALLDEGACDSLIMVYGVMADKDLHGIIPLMPRSASYIFVAPDTARALPAEQTLAQVREGFGEDSPAASLQAAPTVAEGVAIARRMAAENLLQGLRSLIYIGGSTFVVSEAINLF